MAHNGSDVDIVALVKADHRTLRAFFAQMVDADPGQREPLWEELTRLLAAHESAEEMVLFPAVRVISNEHDPMLRARIAEQTEAEELLVRMGDMDRASLDFGSSLQRLHRAVLAHAEAEEAQVLPLIADADKALDRPSLGARYEDAKRRGPTRPHPHAPHTPPANLVAGPLAGLVDRARDRMG